MPRAVILTALRVEYSAVRTHLTDLHEETHPQGTIYERGKFTANGQGWEVGIVEIGAGNAGAAMEAERAISHFKPDVILFVGVAGGIKDVALGDVVASTKVYGYESGKAEQTFKPRPEIGLSAYNLEQRAKAEAKKDDWLKRLSPSASDAHPQVFVAPISAGEKVVASTESEVLQFLRSNYGDAVAVEREGIGFLEAARDNQQVSAMVIGSISDLIDNKAVVDKPGYQTIASRHTSAFAFELVAKLQLQGKDTKTFACNSPSNSRLPITSHQTGVLFMPSNRLPQIEKQLDSLYTQYNEIEDDITNNQNPQARAQSKQQLKNLKPKIQEYEKEYLQVLQQQSTELTFVETDAQAVIDVVAEEVARIEGNSNVYPEELLQQVRAIREKLEQPGTSAALKIKPVISLLPPGIGLAIEGELDTENFLRRNFPTFTRLVKGAKKKSLGGGIGSSG